MGAKPASMEDALKKASMEHDIEDLKKQVTVLTIQNNELQEKLANAGMS